MKVRICVPATSANLGPGFDCLALALDLWNEAEFETGGSEFLVEIRGEGESRLPGDEKNLVIQAYFHALRSTSTPLPGGLHVSMLNRIPTGSGLGSSATAVLMGLLAANTIHGLSLSNEKLLEMAAALEGHGDNAAAALLGGLVVILKTGPAWLTHKFDIPMAQAVFILPEFDLPTQKARKALPPSVSLQDAVYNIGRSVLVVEALRQADLPLLAKVMDDRLHEPFRTKLIPGMREAIETARNAGAAAVISGAGPGLIIFPNREDDILLATICECFHRTGLKTRAYKLNSCPQGAQSTELP